MSDVLEVSYTGDLLAHRRCARAWAYEKYAQFRPHEQAQAMEGRLIHHAMEWLASKYRQDAAHATHGQLRAQLEHYFRVLWARGIRTAFASKQETLDRVISHLFPNNQMHETVLAAVEGAVHSEYELRTVRKILPSDFAGKSRLMLTGILDLVVQQTDDWRHPKSWRWNDLEELTGEVCDVPVSTNKGDIEIWDYKGTKAGTPYIRDYVLQLLTYAGLYFERTQSMPSRCVLFFVNEPQRVRQLVAIPISADLVQRAQDWTISESQRLRTTMLSFEGSPIAIEGGGLDKANEPVGGRIDQELKQQCTACTFRFDCDEYRAHLGRDDHPDIDILNVRKN